MLKDEGYLVKIYVGETDKVEDDIPTYEWIINEAVKASIAGATAIRGIEGFGEHHKVHTAKILQLSTNLPIIIELIDTIEKMESFLPTIIPALNGGLVTQAKVRLQLIRGKQ